jgi:hypothetical protein
VPDSLKFKPKSFLFSSVSPLPSILTPFITHPRVAYPFWN